MVIPREAQRGEAQRKQLLKDVNNRLEELNKIVPEEYEKNHALRKKISQAELKKIYIWLADKLKEPEALESLSDEYSKLNIVKDTSDGKQSIRLPKEITKLPRTLSIITDNDGKLVVILETKSKEVKPMERVGEFKTIKANVTKVSGSYKRGKLGSDITSGEQPIKYMSLVQTFRINPSIKNETKIEPKIKQKIIENIIDNKKYKELKDKIKEKANKVREEISITNEIKSDFIDKPISGPIYGKAYENKSIKGKKSEGGKVLFIQQSIYSLAAECDLQTFIEQEIPKLKAEGKDINEIRRKLAHDILSGLKDIHEHDYVHQDLKPLNILVYKDESGNYSAKISDFGFAKKKGSMKNPGATAKYSSPEIMLYHKSRNFESYVKFIGFNRGGVDLKSINDSEKYERIDENTIHEANDLWAIGLTLAELYEINPHPYPKKVTQAGKLKKIEIQDDACMTNIINGMLERERGERMTAETALTLLDEPKVINEQILGEDKKEVEEIKAEKSVDAVESDTKSAGESDKKPIIFRDISGKDQNTSQNTFSESNDSSFSGSSEFTKSNNPKFTKDEADLLNNAIYNVWINEKISGKGEIFIDKYAIELSTSNEIDDVLQKFLDELCSGNLEIKAKKEILLCLQEVIHNKKNEKANANANANAKTSIIKKIKGVLVKLTKDSKSSRKHSGV